jgi:cobalt-zinc-cadmium efflux system membrane fusion protein
MIAHRIIPAFALAMLVACGSAPAEEAAEGEAPSTPVAENIVALSAAHREQAGIVIGAAERRAIGAMLPVQGTIDVPPQNLVSVSAPMGGYVRTTELLPGMEVQRGQQLAVLEDASFIQMQQDYLVAKGRVALEEKDVQRQTELNLTKTSSDKVLQEATTSLEAQRIAMNGLAEKLRLIGLDPAGLTADNITRGVRLRSPIHGWVSRVDVNMGKYVSPTDVLFELVDPSDIHLALVVFEKDLPVVRIGQHVSANPTSQPERKLKAEILFVSRSLNEAHSAIVHCHFTDMPKDLVPGMAMSALIETTLDTAWTVPEEALVRDGDQQFVFIDKGGDQYEMVPVTTGATKEGVVELRDPPQAAVEGKLVVKGAYALLSLMKSGEEE